MDCRGDCYCRQPGAVVVLEGPGRREAARLLRASLGPKRTHGFSGATVIATLDLLKSCLEGVTARRDNPSSKLKLSAGPAGTTLPMRTCGFAVAKSRPGASAGVFLGGVG
jgi:hypothetical protein